MKKNNRWMAGIIEESAKMDVAMPWARGTDRVWTRRLTDVKLTRRSRTPDVLDRFRPVFAQPGAGLYPAE